MFFCYFRDNHLDGILLISVNFRCVFVHSLGLLVNTGNIDFATLLSKIRECDGPRAQCFVYFRILLSVYFLRRCFLPFWLFSGVSVGLL